MTKKLVIFLHGVGSNGNDLAGLGPHWAPRLPGVAFAAPDAPFRFDHGPGYQWFSLDAITPQNRAARLIAARSAFDATLHALLSAQQIARPENVLLVGFSQGSMMALDALASGRWPLAGVVAFSGRLATPDPLTPRCQTPVLLAHGRVDAVIPWEESESAALRLKTTGLPVETLFENGVGHAISGTGAQRAVSFIARCFGLTDAL
ncbi:alpha/beta hydrolase [Mixta tenebrionis]|uniref:Phospholipase n=1 Tax=Mixta tenebrionis TaxID=2562439 RepID=A0A506V8U7_9GAMM|nr:dienelactone hydrolase family protein [Mixta tenebrionis]TPW41956.1 phospholipase [Mixta tenebrionis]